MSGRSRAICARPPISSTTTTRTGQDKEAEDPPCETVASTADLREVDTARTAAPLCGPDSVASKLSLNLDFDVVSVQVSCEEWSVEATREVAWLEAFAKYEAEFGNNGATLNIGVRAGAGGAFSSRVGSTSSTTHRAR